MTECQVTASADPQVPARLTDGIGDKLALFADRRRAGQQDFFATLAMKGMT
jgi:hypothetical protein